MRIRTFKTALKAASGGQGASHGHPREAKIIKKPMQNLYFCACLHFRFQWPFDASKWPQEAPKRRPRGPKIAPGGLQMALRWHQDKVKRAYDAIKIAIRWPQDNAKTP